MNIAIIDADLIGRKNHRFPNLACEKISGYYNLHNHFVMLKRNYDNLDQFDQVYVSKVFTNTPVPKWLHETDKIHLGGTGFYFDKAKQLPTFIEHCKPDYHLYDGVPNITKEYTDYSIGFLTRGCFRKCQFCVNQNSSRSGPASSLGEFLIYNRKKICLMDDNFFASAGSDFMLQMLINTGKPFKFEQGLDVRLLTDKRCEMLFNCKYDGDYTFAFDDSGNYDLIERKLKLIRKYYAGDHIKFFVLVGYCGNGVEDILDAFKRIELLLNYGMKPYIMRYRSNDGTEPCKLSEFDGVYNTLARWCNQPSLLKKFSFEEFCEKIQKQIKIANYLCKPLQQLLEFNSACYRHNVHDHDKYFTMKFKKWNVEGGHLNEPS